MSADGLRASLAAAPGDVEWPDPSPLGDELPPVEKFDVALLPSSLRALVEDISELMQAPADYAAAAALVALAGCVNRRAFVQPKVLDDSWKVVPNLWGALVGPPGVMKSPALRAVTSPLIEIEKSWQAEYECQEKAFWIKRRRNEIEWAAWAETVKKEYRDGLKGHSVTAAAAGPEKRIEDSDGPKQKRLILTDATFEALHEILTANPAGTLLVRDELTGWLAQLDRQGREGERQFSLQAWNGDGSFTIDRIGRGSLFVPAVCISLIGNIQPARLRSYLAQSAENAVVDDGMVQRFQALVWPDISGDWKNVDRKPQSSALKTAAEIYGKLVAIPVENPVAVRFDAEAQEIFNDWRTTLETRLRKDPGTAPQMLAHLAKYRSLMPSIAALLELADIDDFSRGAVISPDHAVAAVAWCRYLESHAWRVYSCIVSPQCYAARELARHLQEGHPKSSFTARDVYVKGWRGLDTPTCVTDALAILEASNWVRKAPKPPGAAGGRPTESWHVNPKVTSERGF